MNQLLQNLYPYCFVQLFYDLGFDPLLQQFFLRHKCFFSGDLLYALVALVLSCLQSWVEYFFSVDLRDFIFDVNAGLLLFACATVFLGRPTRFFRFIFLDFLTKLFSYATCSFSNTFLRYASSAVTLKVCFFSLFTCTISLVGRKQTNRLSYP